MRRTLGRFSSTHTSIVCRCVWAFFVLRPSRHPPKDPLLVVLSMACLPAFLPACRFVLETDKRLLRLKQYAHSPVTWFRNPMTHLVLVRRATRALLYTPPSPPLHQAHIAHDGEARAAA